MIHRLEQMRDRVRQGEPTIDGGKDERPDVLSECESP